MTVLTLAGKPIDWAHPPKPTDTVLWSQRTVGGKIVKGSFRAIAHLEYLQIEYAKKFGGRKFRVIQSMNNKGVTLSAGTHDEDMVCDLDGPGVPWDDFCMFMRSHGHGGWVRTPAQGFSYHWHGFTLPTREGSSISDDYMVAGFKVGKYVDGGYSLFRRLVTSSQLLDYYRRAFGLSGHHTPGSDRSWYPKSIEATIFDLPAFIREMRGEAPDPLVPNLRLREGNLAHVEHGVPYYYLNSHRGLTVAKREGKTRADRDLQITKDGVVVVTHWPRPLVPHGPKKQDYFIDPLGKVDRNARVRDMTWEEVNRLRSRDGFRINPLSSDIKKAGSLGLGLVLEPKTADARFQSVELWKKIAQACKAAGVPTLSGYALPDNAAALPAMRKAGIPVQRLRAK